MEELHKQVTSVLVLELALRGNLKEKKMKKSLLTLAFTALFSYSSLIQAKLEQPNLERYKTAIISVNYAGSVGELTQQLAEQLNLAYYALKANSTERVQVKQDEASIQNLLDSINAQLHNQQVRFDVLDNKAVLILVNNDIKTINAPQFIGTVSFKQQETKKVEEFLTSQEKQIEPEKNEGIEKPTTEEKPNEKPIEQGITNQTEQSVISSNAPESIQKSDIQTLVAQTNIITEGEMMKETEVKKEISNNLSPTLVTEQVPDLTPQMIKKIQEILTLSQDEQLLAKYSKRKQPIYQVNDKKRIGLDTIRSTKISTFLIFNKDIDTNQYQIIGDFQDIAKLDNIVAILHRQKKPPKTIKVITSTQEEETLTNRN